MIVRCVANTGEALPATSWDPRVGLTADTEFEVMLGRQYEVFAVTVRLNMNWYYVIDNSGSSYPIWKPAVLFDIVDGSIPPSWRLGYFRFSHDRQYSILSFPEWAEDYHFYERLVDEEASAMEIFERRRLKLITPREAFLALSDFIWKFEKHAGPDMPKLLRDTMLDLRGEPVDQETWDNWLASVDKIRLGWAPRG